MRGGEGEGRRRGPDSGQGREQGSRAAIVTGGAGEGIGHGITEALAADGWSVLIVDRDRRAAASLVKKLQGEGHSVAALVANLTAPATPRRAVEMAKRTFGRIDGLVNSAGVGLCKPIAEVSDAEFSRLLDVDLRAAFRMAREAIPQMKQRGGTIVNIGSIHARRTAPLYGTYAAIKAGLEGLTRGIAVDYGRYGIRANCVHPGYVESKQNWNLIRRFSSDPQGWVEDFVATKQLLPHTVTPRQVGELVAFLLGERSAGITAQAFTIDAGTTAMLYSRERES